MALCRRRSLPPRNGRKNCGRVIPIFANRPAQAKRERRLLDALEKEDPTDHDAQEQQPHALGVGCDLDGFIGFPFTLRIIEERHEAEVHV